MRLRNTQLWESLFKSHDLTLRRTIDKRKQFARVRESRHGARFPIILGRADDINESQASSDVALLQSTITLRLSLQPWFNDRIFRERAALDAAILRGIEIRQRGAQLL